MLTSFIEYGYLPWNMVISGDFRYRHDGVG